MVSITPEQLRRTREEMEKNGEVKPFMEEFKEKRFKEKHSSQIPSDSSDVYRDMGVAEVAIWGSAAYEIEKLRQNRRY